MSRGLGDVYKRQEKLWDVLRRNVVTRCAAILTLLVISTAYVVGSTNSPFLYFNF